MMMFTKAEMDRKRRDENESYLAKPTVDHFAIWK